MIDLNLNEFLLLWGVYGMSILLSIIIGRYIGLNKGQNKK